MTRIPRPRPTSPANYPPPAPTRRALESGERRDDSPELYSYDPLTLGGGESPAMRYDRATESYVYDAEPPSGVPEPRPSGIPGPRPSGVPDPRRVPRPPGASLRTPPTTRPDEVRQYGGRGYNGRAPEASVSGAAARYQRERAPEPPDDVPARPPADRRYDQPPPVRRAPARPQQRFEGTYPPRAVRNPRNVVPMQGRPGMASDEDEEEAPGFLHTALVTTAWYTIPLLLYTMYVLTLDGSAQAGDGQSPRESALNGLLGGMPRVGVALVTSLVVALLIRVISNGWRAATIGFASAVVGAGVATVIFTALQG